MNCQELTELSPLYLSGELDRARAAAFAAHLDACPDCARAVEFDTRLRQAVLAEPLDRKIDTEACDLRIRAQSPASSASGESGWQPASRRRSSSAPSSTAPQRTPPRSTPPRRRMHRREVADHERRNWVAQPDQMSALASRLGISESLPPPSTAIGWNTPSCAG